MKKTQNHLRIISLVLIVAGTFIIANSQTIDDARALQPDQTVEREMTGAQIHRYKFDLKANEFFQIRVEQKGVDVLLKLLDASGKVLAEMDSPNGKTGFETLSFVAEKDASFVLETISPNEKAEKGTYIITRVASRAATAQDKRRVEVERIFFESIKAKNTEGQAEIAVAKLKESLAGWEELKDDYLKNLTSQQLYDTQVPPEILSKLKELSKEVDQAFKFLQEGQRLTAKSDTESVTATEKLNQSLLLSQTLNKKVTDKNLIDKIKNSGETANQSLNVLKTFEFYSKYIEAVSFDYFAQLHANLNERQKQLDYYRKAVQVYEEIIADKTFPNITGLNMTAAIANAKDAHAGAIGNIGHTLGEYFGDFEESIRYLEQSAKLFNKLFEETKNNEYKWFEAHQLNFIGSIYGKDSKNSGKAIEYYNKSIEILRTLPDKESEVAGKLTSVGIQYFLQYNFQESFKIFNESIEIYRKLNDKKGQVGVLRQIAFIYYNLNNKVKVAEYVKQILEILQSPDFVYDWKKNINLKKIDSKDFGIYEELFAALFEWNRNDEIAFAYRMLEDYEKSLEFYKKALDAAPKLKNANSTKMTINSVAYTLAKLERWNEASEYYKKALEAARQISGKEDTAIALSDVGWTLTEGKRFDEALKYQNEALAIYQSEGYGDGKNFSPSYSNLLTEISQAYYGLGNKRLAIFYGKLAVNAMQGERQRLKQLDLLSQKGFLEKKEKHYRRLADWLIEEGRFAQAEQVLRMLKEEEYSDFVRRDADEIKTLNQRIELSDDEKKLIEKYKLLADKVGEIGRRFNELEQKSIQLSQRNLKLSEVSPKEEEEYQKLGKDLQDARKAFQLFLDKELVDEIGKDRKEAIEDQQAKYNSGDLEKGTAMLYTVAGEDRYRVILTTPDIQIDGKFEIKVSELNQKVFAFRAALQNPNVDPRPLGKELYDILIKPIEKELKDSGAKTLLWYLDGTLRYIPLAALSPDGKRYLVEDFQNVILTSQTSDLQSQVSVRNWKVLGLGVSVAETIDNPIDPQSKIPFPALPGTKRELLSIISDEGAQNEKGILPGRRFLDEKFTVENFLDSLRLKKYNVVHLASHFYLGSKEDSSFLLLGNGRILPLSEISGSSFIKFGGVDLVTLSACNTAFADSANGAEVDSLADKIQRQGGKSVLATLWSVADESTSLLMSEFYRLRKANPKLTKAEAIQQAQKAMIEGRLKSSTEGNKKRAEIVGASDGKTSAPPFQLDKAKPFSHPYYWSPFVLIGNWK